MSRLGRGGQRVAVAALTAAFGSIVALVAASAPGGARPVQVDGRPTRVLAVGDSVMKGAEGAIPAALAGREVVVDAEVSRSTERSVQSALARGADWDVVVVLLAHNDAGSASAYQPPYRQLLDAYASVPRIVVLTVHEVRSSYPAVNDFLRAEAAARPNVEVLDWNALADANPGATAGDGLHLSNSGASLMAGEIAARVAAVEAGQATTTTTTAAPTTTTTTAPPTTTTAVPTTTTVAPTTTAPPTTAPRARPSVVVRAAPAAPYQPGPHTPRWAWPGVLGGTAALAAVLAREHRIRHRPTNSTEP